MERKSNVLSIIVSIILAVSLFLGGGRAVTTETTVPEPIVSSEDPLLSSLQEIPAAGFDGVFSYVNLDAMFDSIPGLTKPAPDSKLAADSQDMKDAVRVLYRISAGPSTFRQVFNYLSETDEINGFYPLAVSQLIEVNLPPQQQMWLRGSFSPDKLKTALARQNYEALEKDGNDYAVYAPDGDPEGGRNMDLSNRDPGFLFGGMLGQRWPVIFNDSVIGASPDGRIIRAAEGAATLSSRPDLVDLLNAARLLYGDVTPAQVYAMPAELALDIEIMPLTLSRFALVSYYEDGNEYVLILLNTRTEDAANALAAQINANLKDAVLKSSGRTLTDALENWDAAALDVEIAQGENGSYTVALPFRFAERDEDVLASGFGHFVTMLMQRDMRWLFE